ncbi:MAG TPA: hypothetical protein VNQ74_14965, partial [Burkholderiaceae bacterium]|nr:hypothetical protein [Burkholderiaceae bacterium]
LHGAGVQVMFQQYQEEQEPLYINVDGFVFMTLGPIPSTKTERPLARGESLEAHYVITVGDLPAH